MKSARSPLHPEALTLADLAVGQVVACVRFSGSRPMDLITDESNYKKVRILEITDSTVVVESAWLAGCKPDTLDAQEYGLIHNESRAWSNTWCILTQQELQELRDTQRATFRPIINRGVMALQLLIPAG